MSHSTTLPYTQVINKQLRQRRLQHPSYVVWFTGLSGSGKSTLANALEERLYELGMSTYLLDGDNIRQGLCHDLGFSDADRTENIRRIGEVAKLFVDAGLIVLTAFISPFESDRALARSRVESPEFIEVFVRCPLAVCEARDPKGLYAKARAGEIKAFTGIDSPYEDPQNPDIVVDTDQMDVAAAVDLILECLSARGLLLPQEVLS